MNRPFRIVTIDRAKMPEPRRDEFTIKGIQMTLRALIDHHFQWHKTLIRARDMWPDGTIDRGECRIKTRTLIAILRDLEGSTSSRVRVLARKREREARIQIDVRVASDRPAKFLGGRS